MIDSENFYARVHNAKRPWTAGDLTDEMLAEFAGLEPEPVDVSETANADFRARRHDENVRYKSTVTGREKLRAAMRKYSKSAKGRAGARRRAQAKKGMQS
jgi:hypothetical protein